jgi:uncharacterized membrane protein HdeD (DUF308 family)
VSSLQSWFNPKNPDGLVQVMRGHWRLFFAEGVLLLILGVAAVFAPLLAGVAAAVFLGWLFLMAGIAGLVFTFRARGAPGFPWSLLSALVATIAGGLLIWNPFQGLVTLTMVLTAFFIIDGILSIVLGLAHRRELSGRWQGLVVNGGIDLVFAALVILGLPGTLAWALGLLVGIDLAFGGSALIALAWDARKADQPERTPAP